MPTVHIDFETRSRVDIKKCGAGRYAADPSTRILCVCYAVDNGPIMGSFGEGIPPIFHQAVKEGWKFSAFNAIFEQLIWKYRWPDLPMPEFICTRALVASHGLPQGLDRACKALHIGWSKGLDGRRLINKYCVPDKEGKFNALEGEDKKAMLKYCAKDVLLSRRIFQRLPGLLDSEQRIYNWTVRANLRGINIDTELAEKANKIATGLLERGNKELAVLTNGSILSVTQVQRIKNHIQKGYGVETESLDKEAIAELLLRETLPDSVRKILLLRRDLSQTSVKKFSKALMSVCPDDKVRDYLIYHGAATGRWNSQIVQFLNLPRYKAPNPETVLRLLLLGDVDLFDLCYKAPMQELTGCIRSMIIPEKGKKLAIVDYKNIEARMVLWAAEQYDAVDMFRQGIDIYVEMAQQIYGNKALTEKDTKERFLGKTTTLGAGFGMGHIKFQATCEGYGVDLGEKTEYVDREDKEGAVVRTYYSPLARRAIEAYRSRFPKVPKFWYGMQQAAQMCVKTGRAYKFGMATFNIEREYLYMTLPSGRRLAYHRPGCDKDGLYYHTEDSQTHQYGRKRIWGALIVENFIQACARDILAPGILRLEDAGYKVLLTVHDENVVQIDRAEQLEEITNIMCEVPEWAKGCPIAAEGFVTERYKKV